MQPNTLSVRVRAVLVITALLCLVTVAAAGAQTPPAAGAAPEKPAVQRKGEITFGASVQAGVTELVSTSLDGSIAWIAPKWSAELVASNAYGTYSRGGRKDTTVDTTSVSFLVSRKLTPRTFIAAESAYYRNGPQAVDYHFEELVGYGVRLVQSPRGNLTVVGVTGAVQDDKNVPEADGGSFVAGVLQTADAVVAKDAKGEPTWTWSERLLYIDDVTKSDDSRLDFKTKLDRKSVV